MTNASSDIPAIPVIPVILCGGSGTRLWPLSRSGFPKQFLVLSGDDSAKSLFQQAVERLNALGVDKNSSGIEIGTTLIVTNEEHRFLVTDQLRELPQVQTTLLLEPIGRNTAPALTLAALYASEQGSENKQGMFGVEPDPILVITPADQTIQNGAAFTKALQECISVVAVDNSKNTIAILGITPTAPETGYGYIKKGGDQGAHGEFAVEQFAEKPDAQTAQSYVDNGNYFWNSGMFVLRASTWLAALKEFRHDIFGATETAWVARAIDQAGDTEFIRPDNEIFKSIPSESIDYAVIEKCPDSKFQVKMVELNAGWNDLGAWDAVWQVGKKDERGNVTSGDTLLSNANNSLVHATSRLVGAVGIDNLVIIDSADAVLVADRANSQDVKSIVNQLEQQQREEKNLHRKVARPWGWYDSVDEGERFKVKRIQVKPGASLSLQMHHHRAEHWIVVKGTAEITNGDKVIILTENQSTYIPQGQTHRLANPGKTALEIIEVQSGSYLGEDDIVRFEDNYGALLIMGDAKHVMNQSTSMNKRTALICGVSGPDGSYLAQLLLQKGYTVFGTSRDAQGSAFSNLQKLGIKDLIIYISMVPEDFRSVLVALRKSNPDEIYCLAGQSSVGLSFEQPAETIQSITLGTLNILEGCRMMDKPIKIYQAGSGECFGNTHGQPANEVTPFFPMSPYAAAKASAYWLVNNYRDAYSLFACTGILFNHESPLRPERFVTQKIIRAVKRISEGSSERLKLGRLDIARDWGWAPEYVEAMWLMLQQDKPQDFVIATGTTITLEEFVQTAFEQANLTWRDHVIQDPSLFRPTDLAIGRADPSRAQKTLAWSASTKGVEVVKKMYQSL